MSRHPKHPAPDPHAETAARASVPLLCQDPTVAQEIGEIAATVGVLTQVITASRPVPLSPGLVLVAAQQAAAARSLIHPARNRVVVISRGELTPEEWRAALALKAEAVLQLPGDAALVIDLLDPDRGDARAPVVGVIGGRGGAGTTTLCLALARSVVGAGATCALIDLDPLGAGPASLLNGPAGAGTGLHWADLSAARGRLRHGVVRATWPQLDGVQVLTWSPSDPLPRSPSGHAVSAVIDAARRESDVVVIDLPRSVGEGVHAALALVDLALILVPAEAWACEAARRLVATVSPLCGDLRVVVRGPSPAGLRAVDIADALELPLAGSLRAEPRLATALEHGLAPPISARSPLSQWCRRMTSSLLAA